MASNKWKMAAKKRNKRSFFRQAKRSKDSVGNRKRMSVIKSSFHWTANSPVVPQQPMLTHQVLRNNNQAELLSKPMLWPWPFYRLVA